MMLFGSLDPSPRALPTLTLTGLKRWITVNTPLPHEIRQSLGLQSIKYISCGTWRSFVNTRRSFADRVSQVVREFLSDAPFFGLSLWTEFKLANCTCTSGWSCLMNLDLCSKFWLFLSYLVYWVAGLVLARKSYVHCEVQVRTVYQRLF